MKIIPIEEQKRFNGKMPFGIAKLIKGNELSLYIMLLEYHNNFYGYAFPTYDDIRKYFGKGWDNKRIRGYITSLEEKGLIKIGKYKKKVGYDNNTYMVFVPDFSDENVLYKKLQVVEYNIAKVDNAIEMYEDSLKTTSNNKDIYNYILSQIEEQKQLKKVLLLEQQDLLSSLDFKNP
ncbi:MAG: helix-turn-helix domain-containing protein [Paraclostridium sp.]